MKNKDIFAVLQPDVNINGDENLQRGNTINGYLKRVNSSCDEE